MYRSLLLLGLAGFLVAPCSSGLATGKRPAPDEDTRYEDSTGKRGLAGAEPGRYFEANEPIAPGPAQVATPPAATPVTPPRNATQPAALPSGDPASGASHGVAAPPAAQPSAASPASQSPASASPAVTPVPGAAKAP